MKNQDNESTMAGSKVEKKEKKEEEKMEEQSKPVMKSSYIRECAEYEVAFRQVVSKDLPVNVVITLSRKEYDHYFKKDPGIDNVEVTLLHVAVSCHDETSFNFLISNGANVTKETKHFGPVIFNAIMMGSSKMVKALLSAGADPNRRSELWINGRKYAYTPLELAVKKNFVRIVKLLINKGADVNGHNKLNTASPLYLAAKHSATEVMELLLQYRADVNWLVEVAGVAAVETSLSLVIKRGQNLRAARALLRNLRINVDYVDNLGFSYLHYAVLLSHNEEMVACLLDAGININLRDGEGDLPVWYDDDDESCKVCIPVLKEYIIKLIVAEVYVCPENRIAVIGPEFNNLRLRCYEEIYMMKRTRLYNTDLTFFKLLHFSKHMISKMLKQCDLEFTYDDEIRARFPLYSRMLIYRLDRARRQALARFKH